MHGEPERCCKLCNVQKPHDAFASKKSYCKQCVNDQKASWYKKRKVLPRPDFGPNETKQCVWCNTVKPPDAFHWIGKYGKLFSYCKECLAARARSPAYKTKARARTLQSKYGITLAQWETAFAKQGSACAICQTKVTTKRRSWHTDHDHVTGTFRGILCQHCNVGLGEFRDNIEFLSRAIEYLKLQRRRGETVNAEVSRTSG